MTASKKIYMWVAQDLEKTSQHLDPDEFLDVVAMPFATVLDMVYERRDQGRQDGGRHPEICAAAQKRRGAGLMPGRVRLAVCDLAPDWDPRDNYLTPGRCAAAAGSLHSARARPRSRTLFVRHVRACGAEYPCCRIQYSGEDSWPDLNLYDYAIGFPLLDYDGRYLRLPLYAMRDTWAPALQKHKTPPADVFARAGFCAACGQQRLFRRAQRRDGRAVRPRAVAERGRVPQQHRRPGGGQAGVPARVPLCAGIENSADPGYCTEKIVDAWAAGAVPVYGGDPLVKQEFNKPRGLCLRDDYESPAALADALVELSKDRDAFCAMCARRSCCRTAARPPIRPMRRRGISWAALWRAGRTCAATRSCWGSIYENDLKYYHTLAQNAARPKPLWRKIFRF